MSRQADKILIQDATQLDAIAAVSGEPYLSTHSPEKPASFVVVACQRERNRFLEYDWFPVGC
jgi:hypothetical protein